MIIVSVIVTVSSHSRCIVLCVELNVLHSRLLSPSSTSSSISCAATASADARVGREHTDTGSEEGEEGLQRRTRFALVR